MELQSKYTEVKNKVNQFCFTHIVSPLLLQERERFDHSDGWHSSTFADVELVLVSVAVGAIQSHLDAMGLRHSAMVESKERNT